LTLGVNQSALHWDMVCDLRSGSEIRVDDELFCKDGVFVIQVFQSRQTGRDRTGILAFPSGESIRLKSLRASANASGRSPFYDASAREVRTQREPGQIIALVLYCRG
jgi:hypothetical protein